MVYGKDPLPIQSYNLSFIYPAKETEIIIFDRLLVAMVVVFTDLAVVIKHEHWRL